MPWKDPEGSFVILGLDCRSLVKRVKRWGFVEEHLRLQIIAFWSKRVCVGVSYSCMIISAPAYSLRLLTHATSVSLKPIQMMFKCVKVFI